MKLHDHEYFKKQSRMSPTQLEELLSWVAHKITKKMTRFREPIWRRRKIVCDIVAVFGNRGCPVTMTTGDAHNYSK